MPDPSIRPKLAGWSSEDERHAQIMDRLQVLIHVTGHSDRPIQPTPRPLTALDRYEREERRQSTQIVESAWFPNGD